jgi:hypothetical protein
MGLRAMGLRAGRWGYVAKSYGAKGKRLGAKGYGARA